MDSRVDDVVVSTRIRFARNVKGLPFPKRLSGQEEIYSVLMKGVKEACDELFKTKFYKMCDIDELLAQSYVEKHLISNDLVKNVNFGALAVNEDEDISVMINEEDHIREQCVTEGFDLDGAYKKLFRVDEKIAEKLDIAFDPKFGYLTACPTNLGAAMRASVMVFLPALTLTKKINTLINDLQRLDFTTRGVYGEGSGAQGFMYQISNQATVGKSEEDIIKLVKKTVGSIIEIERKERENLKKTLGVELQDKIMRAFGVLTNCYLIDSSEFSQLLGYVKLGVALGYIDRDMAKINKLLTLSQPAMLCMLAAKKLQPRDRDKARAALGRKFLEK